MARQIGKMLNAREPKIVNGPEILNKYVGQSEENIRKLFADAEIEVYKSAPFYRNPRANAELAVQRKRRREWSAHYHFRRVGRYLQAARVNQQRYRRR